MKPLVYVWGDAAQYHNYQAAVLSAGGAIRFGGSPEGCRGLLLPGGGDLEPWRYGAENTASRDLEPARDAAELLLLEQFCAAGLPVLGICRGIQTVNVFFGGTLTQDLPGHRRENGADRLHPVRTAGGAFFPLYGARCIINSAHHQAIARLGCGLEAMQWAEDGVIEGVCHRTLPVWGVQWHPERLQGAAGAADGGALFRAFLRLCGEVQPPAFPYRSAE